MESGEIQRQKWDNKIQFLLTCIGFVVGFGNVWRFPYVLQSNGGGAFLIPYFIMLFLEGMPLLYVELAAGQLLRTGSIGVWQRISPNLAGIGVCNIMACFLVGVYYNTVMAWSIWYMFHSFVDPLPWKSCPLIDNTTKIVGECAASSPSEYFWYRKTLDISPSIEINGGIQGEMLGCLVFAWLLILLSLIKGIDSSGKVVYVTASVPFIVLLIFLGRGLTLEGASAGINHLFSPDFSKLKDFRIWLAAATQIFFSLSLGFGGMIAFSSYNPKRNDCGKDTLIIAIINSATSILAGLVIYSVLGFKATLKYKECFQGNIQTLNEEFGVDLQITTENYEDFLHTIRTHHLALEKCDVWEFIDKGAKGPGLAFIVIADAIVSMGGSQFWALLFFFMLIVLGIDTMFGIVEGMTTPLKDMIHSKMIKQEYILCVTIMASLPVSITFIQGSGSYWLDLFNTHAVGSPLLIIAFFELVAVAWAYKYNRFAKEVQAMLGDKSDWITTGLKYYWLATVPFISPAILVVVFTGFLYQALASPNTYEIWTKEGGMVVTEYPPVATAVGVFISVMLIIWIPLVASIRGIKYLWSLWSNNSVPRNESEMPGIQMTSEERTRNVLNSFDEWDITRNQEATEPKVPTSKKVPHR